MPETEWKNGGLRSSEKVMVLVNDWKNLAYRVRYSFLTQIGGWGRYHSAD